MKDREVSYIDTVKGITIFLMLWGHCIQYCAADSFDFFENIIFKLIYSFHMPLFMLISGYLFFYSFQKRDLKQLLIHRTQSMLQPIVFASMVNIILNKLPSFLKHGSMWLLDGELLSGIYDLWFLWCVLSSSVILGIVCKRTEKLWMQILGVVFGVYIVAMFPNMQLQLYMYPYFVIGFFCCKYQEKLMNIFCKTKYVSIILFPAMMLFYEKKHYIYITPVYSSDLGLIDVVRVNGFRWLIGLVGCIFALTVIEGMFNALFREEKKSLVLNCLSKLGQNSLSIYCLSVSLLSWYLPRIYRRCVVNIFGNVFARNWVVYNLILTPIITIFYCIVIYAVVYALKKLKIHRIIFGR